MRITATARVTLIIAAAVAAAACTAPPLRSWELSDPLMYADQHGDCETQAAECRFASGLLIAVWPDGRLLRAESADAIGLRYEFGSVPPDRIDALLARVNELSRLPADGDENPGTGTAYHRVVVAGEDGVRKSWRFAIPVDAQAHADVEERLIAIMSSKLAESRSIHWSELPRFDAPVSGNWRIVARPR